MNIYRLKYENKDGEARQQFAASDGAASKRSSELKASGDAMKRPERELVDVPTTKAELIDWLNANAGAA